MIRFQWCEFRCFLFSFQADTDYGGMNMAKFCVFVLDGISLTNEIDVMLHKKETEIQ